MATSLFRYRRRIAALEARVVDLEAGRDATVDAAATLEANMAQVRRTVRRHRVRRRRAR